MAINGSLSYPANAAAIYAALGSPVLPVPNFISNIDVFINWYTTFYGYSGGLTHVDGAFLAQIANNQNSTGNNFSLDLNGNNIANTDELLTALDGTGLTNGTFDISGGGNAAPTPAQTGLDDIWTATVPDSNTAGTTVLFCVPADGVDGLFVNFDDTIPIASSFGGTPDMTIGILDNPTGAAIAAKIFSLLGGYATYFSVSVSGNTLTFDLGYGYDPDPHMPLYVVSPGTVTHIQTGRGIIPNAALTSLIGKGCTINTN